MTAPILLGVDLGTTSCKAGAFLLSGEMIGHGSAACSVQRPYAGWVEQDPLDYWRCTVEALGQAMSGLDPSSVLALACCGHTPGLVLVDEEGEAVRPAIIWQDSRASQEAEQLASELAASEWHTLLGMDLPRNASYAPARLRWLRKHEPETLARAAKALQPKDLLNFYLTGKMASDHWSNKGLAHLRTGKAIERYRSLLGIDPALAPISLYPHQVLGALTEKAAAQLRLPAGIPVAAGWSDAMCGMLGTGSLQASGMAFDITGTSEIVGLTTDREPTKQGSVLVAPVLDSDLRIVYGPTQTSGGALNWCMQTFWSGIDGDALNEIDHLVAPSAEGLLFLPYLEGERAPIWDSQARGVFFRISGQHTRAHFLRAVLEGIAFSIRHVLESASAISGITPTSLRLAGGGIASQVWNQIKADILGRPIELAEVRDGGTLGAAMLAGLAVRAFPDLASVSEAMVRKGASFLPDMTKHASYTERFTEYRSLYECLRPLF